MATNCSTSSTLELDTWACAYWLNKNTIQYHPVHGRLDHAQSWAACHSNCTSNVGRAHHVNVSKTQRNPFWLATLLDPQIDWAEWRFRVSCNVCALTPFYNMTIISTGLTVPHVTSETRDDIREAPYPFNRTPTDNWRWKHNFFLF